MNHQILIRYAIILLLSITVVACNITSDPNSETTEQENTFDVDNFVITPTSLSKLDNYEFAQVISKHLAKAPLPKHMLEVNLATAWTNFNGLANEYWENRDIFATVKELQKRYIHYVLEKIQSPIKRIYAFKNAIENTAHGHETDKLKKDFAYYGLREAQDNKLWFEALWFAQFQKENCNIICYENIFKSVIEKSAQSPTRLSEWDMLVYESKEAKYWNRPPHQKFAKEMFEYIRTLPRPQDNAQRWYVALDIARIANLEKEWHFWAQHEIAMHDIAWNLRIDNLNLDKAFDAYHTALKYENTEAREKKWTHKQLTINASRAIDNLMRLRRWDEAYKLAQRASMKDKAEHIQTLAFKRARERGLTRYGLLPDGTVIEIMQ